jgi:GT2 family glycosyltransferase
MLFRRSAYEQVGGHWAVADQVVEDVELARRVKENGLKLRYVLGLDLAIVRMYSSWSALWEGWTKNLYPGSRRNLRAMINLALIMVVIYPLPWIALILALLSLNSLIIGLAA